MHDGVVKLMRERDALRERLSKIDSAIEDYERWASVAAGLVSSASETAMTALLQPNTKDKALSVADPTPVAVFEQRTREVLQATASPLKRTEVHDSPVEVDVVVGGKSPLNTVASRLSRMDGVVNLKGHGYWLEDRPFPPAGHAGSSPEVGALFVSPVEEPGPAGDPYDEGGRT